jgi:hypothetical protein
MSDLLPTVVMPDDVRAAKARLDPFARAVDRSVAVCPQLHPYVRRSWADFYRSWRQFADADASWFHAAAEYDAAKQYEEHLVAWQTQLASVCPIAGPPLTRPPGSSSTNSLNDMKTIAIAGAVVAVALAVRGITR